MKCAVCDSLVPQGYEKFANAWERSRGTFPCCSDECAGRFDPDEHWIPATQPAPASDDDQIRLAKVLRNRLRDGDVPTVVLHEMLQAGVSPAALRKQINEALVASSRDHDTARKLNIMGLLFGRRFKSRDKRDPKLLERALDDLDRWEQRFTDKG